MTPVDWAAVVAGSISVITAFAGMIRWLVKHYLFELVPNSGSSMKDKITRLETRVDEIYTLLLER